MKIGIALGSNLGDRLATFRAAGKALSELPGVKGPIQPSAVYETEPIRCEPGAAPFLNAVIELEYEGDPLTLLKETRKIENRLGRPSDHPRHVSRKIDIDLLYAGDKQIDEPGLQLPHPRLHERRFVLQPLADIRPDLILPGHSRTISELLAQVTDSGKVTRTHWTLE